MAGHVLSEESPVRSQEDWPALFRRQVANNARYWAELVAAHPADAPELHRERDNIVKALGRALQLDAAWEPAADLLLGFHKCVDRQGAMADWERFVQASLEISLLLPVDYPIDAVADSVRKYVYTQFFGIDSTGADPKQLCHSMKDLYFLNYRTSNADIYQEGMASFNWDKRKETRIMHNEHDVLTLEIYDYGYTGGAHGLSVSRYLSIDLKNGHIFTLDEIFREDYRNDLRDIINAQARRQYGLERGQSLVEAGFWNESIEPSENYYITRDGIGFYYNQYEVAPYALGPVNIFVKYRDLNRILHPGSPVRKLISK